MDVNTPCCQTPEQPITVYQFGYDSNGNTVSGRHQAVFDAANRLVEITGKEKYTYDGFGRRVKTQRVSDNKINFSIYASNGQLIAEEDERSNKKTDYVYLNGDLVAQRSAGLTGSTYTNTYLHTDSLGSPVVNTNQAGAATKIERYTPYGEPSDQTYDQGPGYTGHVTDSLTGLTYAQQRYYDPIVGRFLSVDSIETNPNTGAGFNRYWYANDNPYRFTDPDGRQSVGEMIDSGAEGCGAVSCAGWALLNATWSVFGAEGVSQVADKGSKASTSDKAFAVLEVVTAGKGKTVVKGGGKALEYLGKVLKVACSFDDDTLVLTDHGLIRIADIEVGDKVLARNELTGVESYQIVTSNFDEWHSATRTIRLETVNKTESIITTDEHPFFVVGKGFTHAVNLNIGDEVQIAGGASAKVVATRENNVGQLAYN